MTTRIGLVLGSGGLAGTAFHAGVVAALADELGWDARGAHVIVGTSAGSTTAALLRAGFPPADFVARMTGQPLSAEGEALLAGMPPALSVGRTERGDGGGGKRRRPASPGMLARAARRPWTVRPGSLASGLLPPGQVSTAELRSSFTGLLTGWPSEHLWICAVRLSDGARVVFGQDEKRRRVSVSEAVAASCAIPAYYEPVTIDGERYVDGGAHSLCNADLVGDIGLDALVVSAPMSTSDRVALSLDHGWRSAARAQLAVEVRRVVRAGTPVLVVHPTRAEREVMRGASLDARRRPAIARAAYASTRQLLSHARGDAVDAVRSAAQAQRRPR